MKNKTLIIQKHLSIEKARKDINYETKQHFDIEKDDQIVSEWAMAIALANFKIGQKVSYEDFGKAVEEARLQQILDNMVDKGDIMMSVNDNGEIVYAITDQGAAKVENELD